MRADLVHRERVFQEVHAERERQEELKAAGRFEETCADPGMSDFERFAVLGEEVGEVAKAILEEAGRRRRGDDDLRTELTQVAAVAIAWLESIEAGA
jgi:NTP pyrophosphatase (non-canonical NTP hydrolase)